MFKQNFINVLVGAVGLKICYFLSSPFSLFYFIFISERRRAIWQYVKALKPESGRLRRLFFSLRICKSHICSIFESASIPFKFMKVRSIGSDIVRDTIARKKGIIILCTHFGPWCTVFKSLHFIKKIYVVGQKSRGHLWQDKFLSNAAIRDKIIELSSDSSDFSLLEAFSVLQTGEIVGMAGDRMLEKKRRTVKFMNHQVYLPIAPFYLAVKADVSVVPVFSYKTSDREILVHYCDEITPDSTPQEMQLKYVKLLEENVLKFPDKFSPPGGDWIDSPENTPAPSDLK